MYIQNIQQNANAAKKLAGRINIAKNIKPHNVDICWKGVSIVSNKQNHQKNIIAEFIRAH